MAPMLGGGGAGGEHKVNFAAPRSFKTAFKSDLKETFFPDDPFHDFKGKSLPIKAKKTLQYFVPIFEWLPNYTRRLFLYDLLAGITIASLAIPQGISYAKLADIPPVIGLYSSFVPPLIYAVFGSSKHLAVGTVAASSLIIAATLEKKVDPATDPKLYLDLVFTTTLISGVSQLILGVFRLGILVDFLSHSTITGFMGGTATLICLQQLRGIFGLKHFTTHTDVVSVIRAIVKYRKEIRWESTSIGVIFLVFLQFTKFVKQKKPKLFWVSAIAPMVVVVSGCVFAYLAHAEKHGIAIVGDLKKGINPPSLHRLNFDPKYISAPIQAGLITAMIALAEGIAIGRSFAILENEQIDGNKEMIAFGLMNIVGSFTSCYLTTGPFSKTAVNYNAGCKTQMANVVMSMCMMLTLFFLAPLFSYTPLVALSAIIMSAMLGLIEYEKAYHLYKTDKPTSSKLGNIPDTSFYRDVEQYPGATDIPKTLVLQLGVTSIDITGVETLVEVRRSLEAKQIKIVLVNPRLEVMEKLIVTNFIEKIGTECVFLSIEDAIDGCKFSLTRMKDYNSE
ncbi:STAS domain-containing protein [Cynara cardunculus var. scolymus]|uniref:STAS domain-containing protein n=1 Tax=Cynara cardunculus var. scolymus TaxID=59895 RepID=A0A118JVX4_CYNCS|nr:STAS domain-containing protein [Cynara cardunculus var. scolymus]